MASFSLISYFSLVLFIISSVYSDTQTSYLSFKEQESTYKVLESINTETDWRSIYPDDLCYSGPHGLICDYFIDEYGNGSYHITELNIGFVSDYSANPSCSSNASFTPHLTSFTHLRKLFFYKCFTQTEISLPGYFSNLSSTLEELIFIENPSLFGTLSFKISNLIHLKKLVVIGSGISGEIPVQIGGLMELEQITLSRNQFNGEVPMSIGKLKKLKLLDLSFNGFEGEIPDSIGEENTELLKIDLGSNHFNGRIPESFVGLQKLEFLDLSFNHFGNYGVPLFLGELQSLREVYLNGNQLGGQIPEIWEKMGGILGIGLSGVGLVGKIPSSMGVFLRNINYLGLDNNTLEGNVPEEFGLLESVHELNLENNRLSGRLPFSIAAKIGDKLKLKGNLGFCVDEGQLSHYHGGLGFLRLCNKPVIANAVLFNGSSSSSSSSSSSVQEISIFSWFCVRVLFGFMFCLIFYGGE